MTEIDLKNFTVSVFNPGKKNDICLLLQPILYFQKRIHMSTRTLSFTGP